MENEYRAIRFLKEILLFFVCLSLITCDSTPLEEIPSKEHFLTLSSTEGVIGITEDIRRYFIYDSLGDGRPVSVSVWTKDEHALALRLKYSQEFLIGDVQSRHIANLTIATPVGWQKIFESPIDVAKQDSVFEIQWWRDPDTLVLADFENYRSRFTNCGGVFGAWEKYPNDATQGAEIMDIQNQGYNGKNCVKLIYDVDSPNPALVGAFFKLHPDSMNGTKDIKVFYETGYVAIWFKKDPVLGSDSNVQIEFKRPKSDNQAERSIITNVTSQWQVYEARLKEDFSRWSSSGNADISDWSKINEFTITFADTDLVVRQGAILIDDIILVDSKPYSGLNIK